MGEAGQMNGAGAEVDERIEREREWHDERFGDEEGRSLGRMYAINGAGERWYQGAIDGLPDEALVLDYGCGDEAYCAMYAASHGKRARAIDLSPVAIENARGVAEEKGIADRIEFAVMNAEDLDYEDDTFDAVTGLGVIHHLDVDSGVAEIARVLKPGASAFFMEALGHNPVINLIRRMTPRQRTEDEHPLKVEDIETMKKYFDEVDATYLHLLGLLAIPMIGRRGFDGMVDRLGRTDQALFRRVPPARKYAWMACITLTGPR